MKVLHKIGKLSLVILDEKNYAIGEVKPSAEEGGKDVVQNAKYFHQLAPAVKKLASMVADDRAADLWNWVKIYEFVAESIVEGVKEVGP